MSDYLPLIAAAVVAVVGLVGTILARRLRSPTDHAVVGKTHAERRYVEVETARNLLADVHALLDRRTDEYERHLGEERDRAMKDEAVLRQRIADMEARERAFFAAFAGHMSWDRAATAALHTIHPGFPEPPPITLPSGAAVRP